MTANAGVNDPMLQNATNLNNQMIQGDFLQNNPNFDAVMNTAGRKATDLYNTATQGTMSDASKLEDMVQMLMQDYKLVTLVS